jgi:hypothetical protein
MEFEVYLTSKRIDSARFAHAEPQLWQSWKLEFEQLHPNSFTVQKLNLINPIRRKYQLVVVEPPKPPVTPVVKPAVAPVVKQMAASDATTEKTAPPVKVVPRIPRPGMPKPASAVTPDQKISAAGEVEKMSSTSEQAAQITSTSEQPVQMSSAPEQATTQPGTETPTSPARSSTAPPAASQSTTSADSPVPPPKPKPVIPRPIMKPKPKTE